MATYPVIVETLTGKIADGGRVSPVDQRRRSPFHVGRTCTEMNDRAKALGIKTRYVVADGCDYCGATGLVRGWLSHEPPEQCGFCTNGVIPRKDRP